MVPAEEAAMPFERQPSMPSSFQDELVPVMAQTLNQLALSSAGSPTNLKLNITYVPEQTNYYSTQNHNATNSYEIGGSSGIYVTNTTNEYNEFEAPKRKITQRSASQPCPWSHRDEDGAAWTVPKQVVPSQESQNPNRTIEESYPSFQQRAASHQNGETEETAPKQVVIAQESQNPNRTIEGSYPSFQQRAASHHNEETEETTPKQVVVTQDCLLKSMLDERAKAECGKSTVPIKANLRINRVPLQLTNKVERNLTNLDRKGRYKQRSDFRKVMKSPKGNLKLRDIFKIARDAAISKSSIETDNETARKKYVERYGNTVGLIGQAVMAKTTLARLMLQHVLTRETLPETQFLFYIPFRDVDFFNETTLMKFILTGCFGWRHAQNSDKKLINMLQDSPRVVFVFDGLDEANTTCLCDYSPQFDLYSLQKADKFLAKILTGDIFPKAKKLITSRPRQLFEMHSDYRPRFVVDILGLNEEAQLDICRQICKDLCEKVIKYLKLNPDIFACCYVPVNCIITMSILHDRLKQHGTIDIQSLTDIFVHALDAFVRSDHVRKQRGEVWRLSKLAWDGFRANKIVFDERDFMAANISHNVFQAFLCTYVKGEMQSTILQGDKKSSFTHLTWQELFVAIYVMMFYSLEEFCLLIKSDELSKPLWEVVSKFMFGLCNVAVIDRLETILYPKTSENWEDKRNALYNSVRCSLKTTLSCSRLLRLCSWIHEAKDTELNKIVADNFPQVIEFEGSISPTNIVNVIYFLKNATKPLNIRFRRDTLISSDDFNFLCQQLALLPTKVEKLEITRTVIGDSGAIAISKCLDKIDELHLRCCGITAAGIEVIAEKLTQQSIIKLDLSYNKICDAGLHFLTDCFRNMEELELRKIRITDAGVKMLARKLASLSQPMKRLDLCYNKICDSGLDFLSDCLCNIEKLELCHNGITNAGVKILFHKISSLLKPMKILDLSYNNISDEGAFFLSECLSKFEILILSCCKITYVGMEKIEEELARLPVPKPRVIGLSVQLPAE